MVLLMLDIYFKQRSNIVSKKHWIHLYKIIKKRSINVIFMLILKVFLTFIIMQLFIWYIWFDFTKILNIFTKGSEMETAIFADSYHFMILWVIWSISKKWCESDVHFRTILVSYKFWYSGTILYYSICVYVKNKCQVLIKFHH